MDGATDDAAIHRNRPGASFRLALHDRASGWPELTER